MANGFRGSIFFEQVSRPLGKIQLHFLAAGQWSDHACNVGTVRAGRRAPVRLGVSLGALLNDLACGNIERDFHNVIPKRQLTGKVEP